MSATRPVAEPFDAQPARRNQQKPAAGAKQQGAMRETSMPPGLAAVVALQRAAGNAAVVSVMGGKSGEVIAQRAIMPGSAPPDIPGRAKYDAAVAEFRQLRAADQITPEADKDGQPAVSAGSAAISTVDITWRQTSSSGSTAAGIMVGGLATAGGLLADDVTGVGVVDDPLIIPALIIAGGAAAVAALQRAAANRDRSAALDAARATLENVTTTLTEIIIAAKVGDQIRGHTGELAKHLARILNTSVGGMPPDHQGDPPGQNDNHWWKEILNFVKLIAKHGLTSKQLWRELSKRFTPEQIREIIEALKQAAKKMGQDPPDFPPVALP